MIVCRVAATYRIVFRGRRYRLPDGLGVNLGNKNRINILIRRIFSVCDGNFSRSVPVAALLVFGRVATHRPEESLSTRRDDRCSLVLLAYLQRRSSTDPAHSTDAQGNTGRPASAVPNSASGSGYHRPQPLCFPGNWQGREARKRFSRSSAAMEGRCAACHG